MPNWVITRIYITGPEDKIKEFEDKVIDMSEEADKAFSFQRILPIPADLVNTTAPNPRPEIKRVVNSKGEEETVEVYPMFTNQWEINSAVRQRVHLQPRGQDARIPNRLVLSIRGHSKDGRYVSRS